MNQRTIVSARQFLVNGNCLTPITFSAAILSRSFQDCMKNRILCITYFSLSNFFSWQLCLVWLIKFYKHYGGLKIREFSLPFSQTSFWYVFSYYILLGITCFPSPPLVSSNLDLTIESHNPFTFVISKVLVILY